MLTFEDRERAFEAKYAHDEEFRFRLSARRDKLFARWAAERFHLPEADAAEIAHAVISVSDAPGHDDRIVALMRQMLAARGHALASTEVAAALQQCAVAARAELLADPHIPLA